MKPIYFKRMGIFYFPIHGIGWLATLAAAALCIWFFVAIDRNSHSASDTLIHFFVYASCVAFWWKWLAEFTSES
ncbi:hypothetical protein BH10BAC3_BH10BAC3_08620 [soil metagenome]